MFEPDSQISNQERIANLAFALSFLSWALLGLLTPDDAWSLVRICIAAVHVTAAYLILFRAPARQFTSTLNLLLCLPAIVSAGIMFNLAGPTDRWPLPIAFLFLAGTAWAIISLLILGRSFAVFPSLRSVIAKGPYRLVRHPAYLGEIGMVVACVIASDWQSSALTIVAAMLLCFATIVVRILVEERLLGTDESYAEYCRVVSWRLVPWIW